MNRVSLFIACAVVLPWRVVATTPQEAAVWLSFTNVAGTSVGDDSGHGNTGILGTSATVLPTGGPTLPNGATLAAVEFSGAASSENKVLIADSASLDFDKTRGTIVFWVNPDSLPTRAAFVKSHPFGGGSGIEVQKNTYGLFGSPCGWDYAFYAGGYPTALSPGVGIWTHVAYTWNADTDACQFYINGMLNASSAWGSSTTFGATTSGAWYLGWDQSVSGRPLDGRMADVAIFTNVLTASEVFSVYSNGVQFIGGAPVELPLTGLVLQVW